MYDLKSKCTRCHMWFVDAQAENGLTNNGLTNFQEYAVPTG